MRIAVRDTGIGLDVKDGKWWVRTALANVNATIRQAHEKSPSWAFRVDYSKGEFDGWGFASLVGKSPNFNTGTNNGSSCWATRHPLRADRTGAPSMDRWHARQHANAFDA